MVIALNGHRALTADSGTWPPSAETVGTTRTRMIEAMAGRIVSPELIGREAELDQLARAFDAALGGKARAVLVGGEAGIGKSRLLTAMLDQAQEAGALVLLGGCIGLAEGSLPFGPVVEALRPLVRQLDAGSNGATDGVKRVALEDGPAKSLRTVAADLGLIAGARSGAIPAAELRPEWARSRLYEAVLDLLRQLAVDRPVVLAIEDLHWADDSTRELLAFLIRNAQVGPLLLLATFRTDELHRRHPLLLWLAEVDRLPAVERLDLARLGRPELIRQVEAILGHQPTPTLIQAIYERSDGNPFFVEELLAAGAGTRRLPPTLREVLAARLAHVSEPTLRVLGVAAVAGRRVDHDLLARVAGLSEGDLLEALQEATASQLLVTEDDPVSERYAFRHALIGEAAAETVLPGQRRRLHVAIAEALEGERRPGRREDARRLAEIAHHWSEARELSRAFATSLEAGGAAMAAGAYAEALRQFDRALELWDVVKDATQLAGIDRVELLRRAAQAAQLAGDFDPAINLLREAIGLVDEDADPVRIGLLLERLGRAYWTSGELEIALQTYRRAVEHVPPMPATADRARVLAGYAQVLMLSSRYRESLELAREALAMAREVGERQIEGHALTTVGVDLGYVGELDAGIDLIREAISIAEEVRDWDDLGRGYACLSTALDNGGRIEEAWRISLEGVERLRANGLGATYGAFLQMNAADALSVLGRWDEAIRLALEVVPASVGAARIFAHQVLARLQVGRGEFDAGRRSLDEAIRTLGEGVDAQFNGPLAISRMELAAWTGDLAGGRAAADDAMTVLASTEDWATLSAVLATALRVEAEAAERFRAARDTEAVKGAEHRVTTLLERIREIPTDNADPAVQTALDAWMTLASAEAERARGASDPATWARAAELAARRPAPYQAAYARYREAEAMLAARLDRRLIAARLEEARSITEQLGALPLHDAVDALAARARVTLEVASTTEAEVAQPSPATDPLAGFGLTSREIEVLRLVAAGRTNRQIADELFISESTAGVHVSHILGKLGVAGRVEAATIAARLGLAG
jgi:DNA-binding CsgD family transcriptional regulator/tetratricopeptide (TPR) repeat protein